VKVGDLVAPAPGCEHISIESCNGVYPPPRSGLVKKYVESANMWEIAWSTGHSHNDLEWWNEHELVVLNEIW
jgi:hypothetical protein